VEAFDPIMFLVEEVDISLDQIPVQDKICDSHNYLNLFIIRDIQSK